MTEGQPASLYKYLDAGGAAAVLEHGRLRWSAPGTFDDPFELDATASLDFDTALLEQTAGKAIAAAVLSRQAPPGLPNHPITNVIRRWRAQGRFSSEEEVQFALKMVLPAMVEKRRDELEAILTDWRAFATRVRVLCLSERHNDLAQWQRHADNHRGIVLKLAVTDGGSFAAPQAVRYQQRRPQITTLAEQIALLLGQTRHVAQEHFCERLLSKSRADAEQREWRCFRNLAADAPVPPADAPPFDDHPFAADELQAVYLGARLPEARRELLLRLLAARYPRTRVMQSIPSVREFAVEFQPLGGVEEPAPEVGDPAGQPQPALAANSA